MGVKSYLQIITSLRLESMSAFHISLVSANTTQNLEDSFLTAPYSSSKHLNLDVL